MVSNHGYWCFYNISQIVFVEVIFQHPDDTIGVRVALPNSFSPNDDGENDDRDDNNDTDGNADDVDDDDDVHDDDDEDDNGNNGGLDQDVDASTLTKSRR